MFSTEQKDQIRRILRVRSDCPNCGLVDWWKLHDCMYSLPSNNEMLEAEELSLVAITCRECGHTELFNAAAVGIVPEERHTLA